MSKVSLTFNADSWGELYVLIENYSEFAKAGRHNPVTAAAFPELDEPPLEVAMAPVPAPVAPPVPAVSVPQPAKGVAAKPATRKRPEQVAVPEPLPPEPEYVSAPLAQYSEPPEQVLPSLEELKNTVTVAVRAAQKNGGPRKILELLPGFKTQTGLDFVMNAKEEHRTALFNLVEQADLV